MKFIEEIAAVADRFADVGEYAELQHAIKKLCARAAKEGLRGHKPDRVLERVYWVLRRGNMYSYKSGMFSGVRHETTDKALADEFERRSDAFDERTEDMKTLGFKVVRVTCWTVKK